MVLFDTRDPWWWSCYSNDARGYCAYPKHQPAVFTALRYTMTCVSILITAMSAVIVVTAKYVKRDYSAMLLLSLASSMAVDVIVQWLGDPFFLFPIMCMHRRTKIKASSTPGFCFNELIETRETARIAVTEQIESLGGPGAAPVHKMGWALKSAHSNPPLNKTAKKIAEEYFHTQRAMIPKRRAEASFMRKQLEEAIDPSDSSGKRYLLEYSVIPSEKQLLSLFNRLEHSRVSGPKPKKAKVEKATKRTKASLKKATTNTQSKSSVRTTSGTSRKRRVVVESEESGTDIGSEDEDEDEEEEYLKLDGEDCIRKAIEDESDEIFL